MAPFPLPPRLRRAPWWAGFVRLGLSLALAAALAGGPGAQPALAAVNNLVVDRPDDAAGLLCIDVTPDDCTLRSAVNIANGDAATTNITFNNNFTITLTSGLTLSEGGTSVQAQADQVVEINANNIAYAFFITGSDNTLDGLRVYGAAPAFPIIWVAGAAQRVRLLNNIIGDDDPGFLGSCGNSPNAYAGVYVSSTANPASTDAVAWIYGNDIKCIGGAPGHGVELNGSREVVLGADSTGLAGYPQANFIEQNAGDAVRITGDNADSNTIRNSFLQYSDGSGLGIVGGDFNQVYGNYMQANDGPGVQLSGGASLNTIGCPLLAGDPADISLRNVIHQNNLDGVFISGAGTDSNMILCNWIGLNDPGTGPAGNLGNGVQIAGGAEGNIIGAGATTRNVISGNSLSGVLITGAGTRSSVVQGNYIGANAAATAAVGNGLDGVGLTSGATFNTIGGSSASALNIIGGNNAHGVYLSGSGTATNTIRYNDIGLNSAGVVDIPLPNGQDGIHLQLGTHGNQIGGPAMANYIAYNTQEGVSLSIGAYGNRLEGDRIYSNGASGVLLVDTGTNLNQLVGLTIYANSHDGIAERSSATLNTWTQLSTYGNGGLGIDRAATSATTNTPTTPYPVIQWVNVGTGQIHGVASNNATVEVYRAAPDPSGFGEGRTYLGTVVANGSGFWDFFVAAGQANCYTAFQTVAGVSSEFGAHTCPTVYLPLTHR